MRWRGLSAVSAIWYTNWTLRRSSRMRSRTEGPSLAPSSSTSPPKAGVSPAITRASVDLPQPDSPITPTTWPRSMATSMSNSTFIAGLPSGLRP